MWQDTDKKKEQKKKKENAVIFRVYSCCFVQEIALQQVYKYTA